MSKQLMMYETIVPLSSEKHKNWAVSASNGYDFAEGMNSVPLTAGEFTAAASEYAIVFAGKDDEIMPAAILGVQPKENLYLGDNGWKARYVPGFIRRYPFVFSLNKEKDELVLCIDEEYKGFNQNNEGERLFDDNGQKTEYLTNVMNFLQDYQNHSQHTRAFCQKLRELDLLQPMTATVRINGGVEQKVSGFMGVDRERLKKLKPKELSDLTKNDWLELAYLHLQSIRTFGQSLDRVTTPAQFVAANEAEA